MIFQDILLNVVLPWCSVLDNAVDGVVGDLVRAGQLVVRHACVLKPEVKGSDVTPSQVCSGHLCPHVISCGV